MLNLRRVLLLSFFLSGFAALVYEVVWTHLLTLVFGASAYSFSVMLTAFFLGLALGSYTAGKLIKGKKDALTTFAYVEAGIGLSSMVILLFLDEMDVSLHYFYTMSDSFYLFMGSIFLISFLFMLIPTTLMGATLPLVSMIYAEKKEKVGEDIGTIFSFNTLGAIFGSFTAGFVLIPFIGPLTASLFAGMLNISAAFMVFQFSNRGNWPRFYALLSVVLIMGISMNSFTFQPVVTGIYEITRSPGGVPGKQIDRQVIFSGSNAYGTVAVTEKGPFRSLWINNKVDASTTPMDMSTQLLLGYLPMFSNPDAKKALNIGLGAGLSLGVIEAFDVSQVDVIELNPLVVEAARRHFSEYNSNALDDGRVRLIIADARNYLLTSNDQYDIIISEPSNLWVSGESGLFTREFYHIVKEHLQENGVFSQWIPFYDFSEADTKIFFHTITEVFPSATLWITGNDGILIASNAPAALDYSYIRSTWEKNPRIRSDMDLLASDFRELPEKDLPDAILKNFALSYDQLRDYAGNAPFHTDDHPVLEFNTGRNFLFLQDKSRSVAGIMEYRSSAMKNGINQDPRVKNIDHQEEDWHILDFLGVKVGTVNWTNIFSGYTLLGLDPVLSDTSTYSKSARFRDNTSFFTITTRQSKIRTYSEDSQDTAHGKNIQRQQEIKEILQAKQPGFNASEFEKNGEMAYLIEYRKDERIKAVIGGYCGADNIIYVLDLDADDESVLLKMKHDIQCI